MDCLLASLPPLQEGGEFEATEILAIKRELSRLLKILPDANQWCSASWEHQNETSEFYRLLKEFSFSAMGKWGFEQALQRLQQQAREDEKVLVPCGVLAYRKLDNEYSWYFYQVGLTVNSEG